ncbi:MAG TPA: glycosyltransferase [Gemmatimonadales bacterium]|nr:glycosyltransferase [Gemmatimonadales bacterium]
MAARIVINCWGSYGDLNPYLGLALQLRARGHHPVLATMPRYQADVEREGLEFRPVGPDTAIEDRELIRRVMDPVRGGEVLLREIVLPGVEASFEALWRATEGADLVVSHPVTFAAPLVAGTRGLPWISTVLAPLSFFSVHDFPVLPPAPGLARLHSLPGMGRLFRAAIRATTRRWGDPVRRLRARLGLPPGGDPLYEGQFSPHGTLALFSPVLARPQPDWPPRTRVTGAIHYDRSTGGDGLGPPLEGFLASGPPPVVFTLGSAAVMAPGRFFEESLAAVRRLGVRAVLLVGREGASRRLDAPSDQVCVVEAAPFGLLFPRAAAIVHQGGAGTLAQALRAGRPQLVVPYAHDQPDNAHRLARLGVARIVHPRRYRAGRVAAELSTLLGDARLADAARRVARGVGNGDGAAAAGAAIEDVLAVLVPGPGGR